MKTVRFLSVLLLSLMMGMLLIIPAFAANDLGVTYSAEVADIEVSDQEQTVVVTIMTNKQVELDSITASATTNSPFAIAAIGNSTFTGINGGHINVSIGGLSYYTPDGENLTTSVLAEYTIKVPANTPAGTYDVLTFNIAEITKDYFSDFWETGTTVTATLTINEAAPSCDHSTTKAVPNGDGATHKLVCANEACNGHVVTASVACSGGTATCTAKATCTECGQSYGDLAKHTYNNGNKGTLVNAGDCKTPATYAAKCDYCDFEHATNTVEGALGAHTYGQLIEATGTVHTQTELKGAVAAHYFCDVCDTYFTEGKDATTLEALTGDAPEHAHDHYDTTANQHQSICSCGKPIGEAAGCEISKETKKCTVCYADCSHVHFANSSVKYQDNGDKTHVYKVFCNDCNDWGIKDAAQPCVDTDGNGYCDLCHLHAGWSDNGNGTCSQVCACGLNNGPSNHAFLFGTCSRCGATEHVCSANLTAHEAAEATCTTAGHKAYYVCECTKAYEDAAATDPIEDLVAWKSAGGDGYIAPDSTNHASDKVIYTNNDKNHSATYDCCGAAYVTNEAHTYTNHVCVCGYVEMFVITMDANGGKFSNGAPVYPVKAEYGAPFNAVPADPTKEGYKFVSWNTKADGTGDDIDLTPGTYTFTADLTVYAQWEVAIHSGWNEIDGEWYYYLDEQTKATGLTRVPYPTVAIDGVTYAPNAEDLAYYNANKDTSKYSDATTAVFYFDENGVFQNDYTGPVANGSSYAVNGMAPWHVGMVKIGADYYYYSGDKTVGGNVLTTGKVYATRDCGTGLRVGAGVVYIFDGEGKLEKNQGIVDGYYYADDYTLAIGAGLVQIENDYYYVRSNGVVVVDREYWVAKTNDLEVVAGLYTFDADGKMVDPVEFDGAEDGIVELNGDLYYIKDGKCVVGAGVVKLTDAEGATFYIYVKSSGKLATGKYWPTNLNDLLDPGMYNWGADGKYYPAAN